MKIWSGSKFIISTKFLPRNKLKDKAIFQYGLSALNNIETFLKIRTDPYIPFSNKDSWYPQCKNVYLV